VIRSLFVSECVSLRIEMKEWSNFGGSISG
jgi:hypothetical protein